MKIHLERKLGQLKAFYRLYTTGLNRREVERLLKKDAQEAFEYFKEKTSLADAAPAERSFRATLGVVREIFLSFLMQLTPARRLFYGLGVLGFILGFLWTAHFLVIAGFVILNLLIALELADKLTTRDELEIAREIQVSLQPQVLPRMPGLSMGAYSRAAKIVGGDFFDVVKRGDGQLLGILGDVAGKGIPAALYAAHIQSMFESLSEQSPAPADIMGGLNKLICRRLREGDFVTAAIVYFNTQSSSVTVARAGHNWPLHYDARTQAVRCLKPPGVCLGMDHGPGFAECLREEEVPVSRGDVLLLYSDGVTEAMNPRKQLFDLSRLKAALLENAVAPAEKLVAGINRRLEEFVDSEELHDDVTLLAIKVD